jgi:hypothetical protein
MSQLLLHVFECALALTNRQRRKGSPQNLEVQLLQSQLDADWIENTSIEGRALIPPSGLRSWDSNTTPMRSLLASWRSALANMTNPIAQLAPRGVHQTKVVDHDQLYAVTPNVEPGAGK